MLRSDIQPLARQSLKSGLFSAFQRVNNWQLATAIASPYLAKTLVNH
jgi:hypothetical protein